MNPQNAEPDHYQTYLLRLWRVPRQGKWQWCASLESRHTGERQSFAAVEQLFAFLKERCIGEEGLRVPPSEKEMPMGLGSSLENEINKSENLKKGRKP